MKFIQLFNVHLPGVTLFFLQQAHAIVSLIAFRTLELRPAYNIGLRALLK